MKKIKGVIVFILLVDIGFFAWSIISRNDAQKIITEEMNVENLQSFDDSGLVGNWVSLDDEKFVRNLNSDKTFLDYYDNEITSAGIWFTFSSEEFPESFPYPVESGKNYLVLNDGSLSLNFIIAETTQDSLVLIYMDNGGVLQFTKDNN